jgi:hypothetical protein
MTSRRVALIGLEILTFQELLSWIFGRVHITFRCSKRVCVCGDPYHLNSSSNLDNLNI